MAILRIGLHISTKKNTSTNVVEIPIGSSQDLVTHKTTNNLIAYQGKTIDQAAALTTAQNYIQLISAAIQNQTAGIFYDVHGSDSFKQIVSREQCINIMATPVFKQALSKISKITHVGTKTDPLKDYSSIYFSVTTTQEYVTEVGIDLLNKDLGFLGIYFDDPRKIAEINNENEGTLHQHEGQAPHSH